MADSEPPNPEPSDLDFDLDFDLGDFDAEFDTPKSDAASADDPGADALSRDLDSLLGGGRKQSNTPRDSAAGAQDDDGENEDEIEPDEDEPAETDPEPAEIPGVELDEEFGGDIPEGDGGDDELEIEEEEQGIELEEDFGDGESEIPEESPNIEEGELPERAATELEEGPATASDQLSDIEADLEADLEVPLLDDPWEPGDETEAEESARDAAAPAPAEEDEAGVSAAALAAARRRRERARPKRQSKPPPLGEDEFEVVFDDDPIGEIVSPAASPDDSIAALDEPADEIAAELDEPAPDELADDLAAELDEPEAEVAPVLDEPVLDEPAFDEPDLDELEIDAELEPELSTGSPAAAPASAGDDADDLAVELEEEPELSSLQPRALDPLELEPPLAATKSALDEEPPDELDVEIDVELDVDAGSEDQIEAEIGGGEPVENRADFRAPAARVGEFDDDDWEDEMATGVEQPQPETANEAGADDEVEAEIELADGARASADEDTDADPEASGKAKFLQFKPLELAGLAAVLIACLVGLFMLSSSVNGKLREAREDVVEVSTKVPRRVKGEHVQLGGLECYWRNRLDSDRVDELSRILPVLEISAPSGEGFVQVLFRDIEGEIRGDALTYKVSGGQFADGGETMTALGTEGLPNEMDFAYYRSETRIAGFDQWTVTIRDSADGENWNHIVRFEVPPKRKASDE